MRSFKRLFPGHRRIVKRLRAEMEVFAALPNIRYSSVPAAICSGYDGKASYGIRIARTAIAADGGRNIFVIPVMTEITVPMSKAATVSGAFTAVQNNLASVPVTAHSVSTEKVLTGVRSALFPRHVNSVNATRSGGQTRNLNRF